MSISSLKFPQVNKELRFLYLKPWGLGWNVFKAGPHRLLVDFQVPELVGSWWMDHLMTFGQGDPLKL